MAKVTAAEFKAALDGYRAKQFPTIIRRRQMEIVEALWEGILKKHPVLTGRSRNNWNATMGAPDYTTDENRLGGVSLGSDLTAREEAQLAAVKNRLNELPLGQIVYLANGIKYVKFLEAGSSKKQAPSGMVAVTIQEVIERIKASG